MSLYYFGSMVITLVVVSCLWCLFVIQELGYSPFRPHMSFTGSASTSKQSEPPAPVYVRTTPSSGPVAGTNTTSPFPYPFSGPGEDGAGEERLAEEEALAEGDVDDALAMLLSLGRCCQPLLAVSPRAKRNL